MSACFGQVQPKKLTIFFSYSGGGLQWFAVVCGGLPASSLVSLAAVASRQGRQGRQSLGAPE